VDVFGTQSRFADVYRMGCGTWRSLGVGAAANSHKFPKYLPRGATLFDFVVVYSGIKKRISGRSLLSTIVLCYVCDAHNNAWCRGTEVRKH